MKTKQITINGHQLPGPLLIEDPDARSVLIDTNGQRRHVRSYKTPAGLRRYLQRHPEGVIIAGCGIFLFGDPAPVTAAGICYNENGGADITIRENAAEIRRELETIEMMQRAARDYLNAAPDAPQS